MSKYNPLVEYIQTLIQPFPNRYTMGEYTISVSPRSDLTEEEIVKYWRVFGKFPNEFASACARMLPRDIEFRSYDHLQNKLTLFKQ